MKSTPYVAFAVAIAFFVAILQGSIERPPKDLARGSEMGRRPSLPPGAKIAVIEGPFKRSRSLYVPTEVPCQHQVPAHWHPAVERVTVLSGTFNMGMGDKLDMQKSMPLSPGSMMIMQPKTNHFAWTKEEVVVQLNGTGPWGITYVNPRMTQEK
jgi:anti-sigma factor ChrR (cupin superfamily)